MCRAARALAGIAFCALAAFTPVTSRADDEVRSSITVLVDLSRTWLNDASAGDNRRVMQTIGKSIAEMPRHYRTPIHIRYVPIGDNSLLRPPLCQAIYDPKLIGQRTAKSLQITKEHELLKYLTQDCIEFILKRKPEPFTDITGALDSASRLTAAQVGDTRAIVVLSDMVEDRRPSQTQSPLSLGGFVVVVMYRALADDRQHPDRLDKRLSEWRAVLNRSGTKAVELYPDSSLTSSQLTRLLSK